ncbi:ricin-type beta-trefoil lectin domain protein [Streptomyces sp. LE64]|uniref:ricin-type beta-trefoil lectin domain protein n=1 Tax=Streptomyces sp. LE64 TaxID=3448653 RepID=UPI00404214DF
MTARLPTPRRHGRRRGRVPTAAAPGRRVLPATALVVAVAAVAALTTAWWSGRDAAGSAPPRQRDAGALRGALLNVGTGLCLDVLGRRPVQGARAALLPCADGRTMQWSYEGDGLLRSGADARLCLDSHAAEGLAALDSCAGRDADHGTDVRYDLTVQGQLVPRWKDDLALAPIAAGAGAAVAVKVRDRSARQRWAFEPGP